jgi:hypothetical protein
MADAGGRQPMLAQVLRWIARAVLLVWALLWLFYYATLALTGYGESGMHGVVLPAAIFAAIVVCLVLAWNFEMLAAVLFVAGGLLAVTQWEQPHWFSLITITIPLIVTGLLLACAWGVARARQAAAATPAIAPPAETGTEDETRWDDPGW